MAKNDTGLSDAPRGGVVKTSVRLVLSKPHTVGSIGRDARFTLLQGLPAGSLTCADVDKAIAAGVVRAVEA